MSAENALKKRTMKRIMVKRDVPTVTAAQAKVAETGADLRNAEVEGQRIIKRSRHAGGHVGSRPFRPCWTVQPLWTGQNSSISPEQ